MATLEQLRVAEGCGLTADGSYYICNLFGGTRIKDGRGYTARLTHGGVSVERYWSAKLDAPKGIAILDGALCVTDIDKGVMVDTETGSHKSQIATDGAKSPTTQQYGTDRSSSRSPAVRGSMCWTAKRRQSGWKTMR